VIRPLSVDKVVLLDKFYNLTTHLES